MGMESLCFSSIQGQYCTCQLQLLRVAFTNWFVWNGAEEYIFHLSAQVCVGDEICWDFVDLTTTLKCNFSAFCHIMNAKYARRGKKAGNFVSPKTFRN